MDIALALFQWLCAPVVALTISWHYFRTSHGTPTGERIMVSAHGVVIAFLYFAALGIHMLGLSRPELERPYWVAFVVPVVCIVIALIKYKGARSTHLYQLANVLCGIWALFVGTMAVTGNWL